MKKDENKSKTMRKAQQEPAVEKKLEEKSTPKRKPTISKEDWVYKKTKPSRSEDQSSGDDTHFRRRLLKIVNRGKTNKDVEREPEILIRLEEGQHLSAIQSKKIAEDVNATLGKVVLDERLEYLVTGRNLTKKYGKFIALDNISFGISKGSFHAIAGENGSGKTTLVKMISSAFPPTSFTGVLRYVSDELRISYTPENVVFPSNWTVWNYLYNLAYLITSDRNSARYRTEEAIKSLKIEDLANRFPNRLSTGQKKKVLLAKIEIEDAELVILDEPAANLDFTYRDFLFKKLVEWNTLGKTIVIISHLVKEAEQFVNEVTLIHYGKLLLSRKINPNTLSEVYRDALLSYAKREVNRAVE